jgi:uncharacterized protein YbcI
MNEIDANIAKQLADAANHFQTQRTGHAAKGVTVVLTDNTLVVNFHGALTPAEKQLSRTPAGAAQVQEFHRQLFANSSDGMREEILRLTGRHVCEASGEIADSTAVVMQSLTTGDMVQVYSLTHSARR